MNQDDEKIIRATHTDSTIRVYQAYSTKLAHLAVQNNSFKHNPFFKMTRMTWIKPSFLWMMYRSGWGKKDGEQQTILAIDLCKEGFDWALQHSCSSHKPLHLSDEQWLNLKQETPVRIQWDPDPNLLLEPQNYRAIQIGLSNVAIEHYVNDWVVQITDITETAQHIHQLVINQEFEIANSLLPKESIYIPNISKLVKEL
ncbi:DUF4291 domain-containing protein [Acinetobacter beijerinckii]|uniref:DUF4291 domain-containing protein n=1 Tax=Acinetobacter beijerinckii ANC 3835 TaxID=1217649 RepID=N9E698_9GAMM|nr:DUF4291 domain-containing protein [Acinetobacter beijerinckii]ENW05988.1 hypothetical protein F934_00845 [Acinetobacter beijerinckii ANC 3835]